MPLFDTICSYARIHAVIDDELFDILEKNRYHIGKISDDYFLLPEHELHDLMTILDDEGVEYEVENEAA